MLVDGVLSYYMSHDELNAGSKGSLSVILADIEGNKPFIELCVGISIINISFLPPTSIVSESDPLRFDVIIPDQQHMYLRAFSARCSALLISST